MKWAATVMEKERDEGRGGCCCCSGVKRNEGWVGFCDLKEG